MYQLIYTDLWMLALCSDWKNFNLLRRLEGPGRCILTNHTFNIPTDIMVTQFNS